MKNFLLLCAVFLFTSKAFAQLEPNFLGSAFSNGGDCYVVTSNTMSQLGYIWYNNVIDFNSDFEIVFDANFGENDDDGADGMTLVMKNNPNVETGSGTQGSGLGYQGIMSSIAVEFDTYQNSELGDIASDHVALISNGSTSHTQASNLAGPVDALANSINIEDDQFHQVRIFWTAATQTFVVEIDCVERLSYTGDLVNNVFGGESNIYFGFTGSTGLYYNHQQLCFKYLSFTDTVDTLDRTICLGDSVTDVDVSYTGALGYQWSPTTGVSDASIADPVFTPETTTTYTVDITDTCGEIVSKSFEIEVNEVAFNSVEPVNATICTGNDAEFILQGSPNAQVTYNINNGADQTVQLDNTGEASVLVSSVTTDQIITVTFIESTDGSGCTASLSNTATVSIESDSDASFSYTATCDGGIAQITGDVGGVFSFDTVPADGALLDESTGELTNAQPNTTYTIVYTTQGVCSSSSTQTVTTLDEDDASFTLIPDTCGATAEVFGDEGGIFSFTTPPNDGAQVNPQTGEITNGNLGTTYSVSYTTNGDCPQTEVVTVTIETCIIPEVITPNGDGKNDTFDLGGFRVSSIHIFNRYGTSVFEKSNGYVDEFEGVSKSGDKLPTGTYFYTLVFQDNSTRTGWLYINREK